MMKNENLNPENEDFIKWIKNEANPGDDNLEDNVMDKILQQHSTIASRKTPILSIKTITIGYSILALVMLTWCFLDSSIIAYLDMFDPGEELTTVNQHIGYIFTIIATGTLSLIFFLIHWIQSKHFADNSRSQIY
jgi:hypothetical protein